MFRLIVLMALFVSVFMGIIDTGIQLINTICEHKIDEDLDEDVDEDMDDFPD